MSNEDIAGIIYHAGVAVDMDYDFPASGTYTGKISIAFKDYFGYQSGVFEKKSDFFNVALLSRLVLINSLICLSALSIQAIKPGGRESLLPKEESSE